MKNVKCEGCNIGFLGAGSTVRAVAVGAVRAMGGGGSSWVVVIGRWHPSLPSSTPQLPTFPLHR